MKQVLPRRYLRWDWQHKGRTWSWQIRKMLKGCNEDFTLNDDNIDFSRILPNVKNHLMSEEIKIWKKDLSVQPKLRFYREFKLDYKTETYVKSNLSRSSRSFIAQLRSGVLPLRVETGRFINLELKDRLCKACEGLFIEDEMHFIFYCPCYNTLRNEFFNIVQKSVDIVGLNNHVIINALMNNDKLLVRFGNFISNCYYKRNDKLYV